MAFLTTAVMVLSLSSNVYASNGDTGSPDLQVDYHTKAEIADYIKNHPDSDAFKVNYDVNPVITPPYALGKISDSSLNGTITLMNTFRYIAGIPANVTLNSEYNELAQSAALVNAANNQMSHYPVQPSGMSNEMYQKGKKGAGSSNLGWGYGSLGSALKSGWMSDANASNIDRIGHRRWVLNPSMAQTGFGYAGSYSAMYAFDSSNSEGKNYKGVAWPAQNTPVGYFPKNDPWSISLGEEVISATVTLTCVNTGQQWVFGGEPNCCIN
ncbi:MAG: CAP domain-containing protein, partial [Lachnospiraceae bacterium]|nr:CAP domain-containing protein [Lachnospiraceae bacterium]